MLIILPSPIPELQHALLPPKCYEPGSVPQLFALLLFSLQIRLSVIEFVICLVSNQSTLKNLGKPKKNSMTSFHMTMHATWYFNL